MLCVQSYLVILYVHHLQSLFHFIGQVFLAATVSLDYEITKSHELVIEARDQGTNPAALTATTTLSVLINGEFNVQFLIC